MMKGGSVMVEYESRGWENLLAMRKKYVLETDAFAVMDLKTINKGASQGPLSFFIASVL